METQHMAEKNQRPVRKMCGLLWGTFKTTMEWMEESRKDGGRSDKWGPKYEWAKLGRDRKMWKAIISPSMSVPTLVQTWSMGEDQTLHTTDKCLPVTRYPSVVFQQTYCSRGMRYEKCQTAMANHFLDVRLSFLGNNPYYLKKPRGNCCPLLFFFFQDFDADTSVVRENPSWLICEGYLSDLTCSSPLTLLKD